MQGDFRNGQAGRGFFQSAITGLANLSAVVAAFLGTPFFFAQTIGWVQRMSVMHYGNGYQEPIGIAWFVISAGLIFCVAKAVIGTVMEMLRASLATRMF